jgi:hypothetical protein
MEWQTAHGPRSVARPFSETKLTYCEPTVQLWARVFTKALWPAGAVRLDCTHHTGFGVAACPPTPMFIAQTLTDTLVLLEQ